MGCLLSSARYDGSSQDDSQFLLPVVTFFPGLRLPLRKANSGGGLNGLDSTDELTASQDRLISLALAVEEEMAAVFSPNQRSDRRKSASQHPDHGGSNFADLQQALEDYLVLLVSSAKKDTKFELAVPLIWKNQEDEQLETPISNWHQEVLSVLHAMAVLDLFQANLLLSQNGFQMTSSRETSKQAIDIFLKVSGVLDCALKYIIPQFSEETRVKLPFDLKEGVLHALSMQALGQGVEIQLGFAIDNMKATLAVKRRLACEQVEYLQKAHEDLQNVEVDGLWGKKHQLFMIWKLAEAKAAAFYFHGLVLDESDEDCERSEALLCLQSASGYLKESQKFCQNFCLASPTTRLSPVWGAMKYLSERIPKEFSSKSRSWRVVREEKLGCEVPELPDFPLSLHPEEFKLPEV